MYVLSWRTVSVLTRVLFWCLFIIIINTKITLLWALKWFVTPAAAGGWLDQLNSARHGSQHPPPRRLTPHPPQRPAQPPTPTPTAPRTTPPTTPSATPSTHPHGAPYHPANRPLHGSQHPPPRHPPPPAPKSPPRPPQRGPAQPPEVVEEFPRLKFFRGAEQKWNKGPPPRQAPGGGPPPSSPGAVAVYSTRTTY